MVLNRPADQLYGCMQPNAAFNTNRARQRFATNFYTHLDMQSIKPNRKKINAFIHPYSKSGKKICVVK